MPGALSKHTIYLAPRSPCEMRPSVRHLVSAVPPPGSTLTSGLAPSATRGERGEEEGEGLTE